MMKLFSVVLAVLLVFSLSVCSFADGGMKEYNWSSVKDQLPAVFAEGCVEGLIEEVDATFCLPGLFYPVPLTEEDIKENYIGFLVSEDGNSFILFSYDDMDNNTSLDFLYSYYTQNGINAEKILVNGIPALLQRDFENNILLLSYHTQEDKLLQLMFSPLSNESIYEYIIASIQPRVEETAAEPVVPVNPVSSLISK